MMENGDNEIRPFCSLGRLANRTVGPMTSYRSEVLAGLNTFSSFFSLLFEALELLRLINQPQQKVCGLVQNQAVTVHPWSLDTWLSPVIHMMTERF